MPDHFAAEFLVARRDRRWRGSGVVFHADRRLGPRRSGRLRFERGVDLKLASVVDETALALDGYGVQVGGIEALCRGGEGPGDTGRHPDFL